MANLNKRAYDERIMHVDLSPVMRGDDTVDAITSVDAILRKPAGESASLAFSNITPHDRAVSFKASAGHPGQGYDVRIRFTTNSGVAQAIEGIVGLDIEE